MVWVASSFDKCWSFSSKNNKTFSERHKFGDRRLLCSFLALRKSSYALIVGVFKHMRFNDPLRWVKFIWRDWFWENHTFDINWLPCEASPVSRFAPGTKRVTFFHRSNPRWVSIVKGLSMTGQTCVVCVGVSVCTFFKGIRISACMLVPSWKI